MHIHKKEHHMRINKHVFQQLVKVPQAPLDETLHSDQRKAQAETEPPDNAPEPPRIALPGASPALPPGVARGLENEQAVLVSLHEYGWLTARQVGRLVWREGTYGVQMSRRVLRRLEKKGLVVERMLPTKTSAWVLSSSGANALRASGIDARRGTDQRVDNITWRHRWLVNEFLILKDPTGITKYSEYAILAHRGPFPLTDTPRGRRPDRKWLGKIPDALWTKQDGDVALVSWIEVERTHKRPADLKQLCEFIVRGMHQPVIAHSVLELSEIYLVYTWDSQRPETRAQVYPLIRALVRGIRAAFDHHFEPYDAVTVDAYAETLFESVYLALLDVGPGPILRDGIQGWRLQYVWHEEGLAALKQELVEDGGRKHKRR